MKTTQLFTAVALTLAAAAGPVLAQEATYEYPLPLTSQTTRSAVQAELLSLRSSGHVLVSEANVGIDASAPSQLSREAVRNEARAAAKSGLTRALTAEPHDFSVSAAPLAATVTAAIR